MSTQTQTNGHTQNGTDAATIDLQAWRDAVAMITQRAADHYGPDLAGRVAKAGRIVLDGLHSRHHLNGLPESLDLQSCFFGRTDHASTTFGIRRHFRSRVPDTILAEHDDRPGFLRLCFE